VTETVLCKKYDRKKIDKKTGQLRLARSPTSGLPFDFYSEMKKQSQGCLTLVIWPWPSQPKFLSYRWLIGLSRYLARHPQSS